MESGQGLSQILNLSSRTSTFVSIDVVGSTTLKAGENEQDVIYTFLAYHKLVNDLSYEHHGQVIHITGDGMLCRFEKASDAVALCGGALAGIPLFNKKQNRLSRPLAIRLGVHTGHVMENESLDAGQIISQTLDITAKLQQAAQTNHACLSEATVSLIPNFSSKFKRLGWNATLQVNMYDFAGETGSVQTARAMPSTVRVLIVEPEIDEAARLRKILFARSHELFGVFTQNQASIPLTTWKPHVTLISLDLAWDTGWELLASIRATQSLSTLPVIAMSRVGTGELIQKSFRVGANGFLKKPLDPTQTIKRMDTVLREFYL